MNIVSSFFFLFFNRVISVISVVLRETTLTFLDAIGDTVSTESEIVRVVSLSTTEISEITRLKIESSRSGYYKSNIYIFLNNYFKNNSIKRDNLLKTRLEACDN